MYNNNRRRPPRVTGVRAARCAVPWMDGPVRAPPPGAARARARVVRSRRATHRAQPHAPPRPLAKPARQRRPRPPPSGWRLGAAPQTQTIRGSRPLPQHGSGQEPCTSSRWAQGGGQGRGHRSRDFGSGVSSVRWGSRRKLSDCEMSSFRRVTADARRLRVHGQAGGTVSTPSAVREPPMPAGGHASGAVLAG